jgi:hypothetical protein
MPKASYKAIRGARRLVLLRDGHWCQMCSRSVVDYPSSVHHRRPRGAGGSALLERASNLVRLCGTGTTDDCHHWVESNREHAAQIGWLIPKLNLSIDPARTPLLTFKGWVLLDDEGGSTPWSEPLGA